jgi:hypothetical protein
MAKPKQPRRPSAGQEILIFERDTGMVGLNRSQKQKLRLALTELLVEAARNEHEREKDDE